MAQLRSRNAALLSKIESPAGAYIAMSASADGILVRAPQIKFNQQNVNTDEVTGSLDGRGPIIGGTQCEISFGAYLKGSGTAGVAPEWGKLMKGCGWAETATASAVPASPENLTGGTTTGATLSTGASATAQAYRGMPIAISGGTGAVAAANGTYFVSDYTTGKVATLSQVAGSGTAGTGNLWQVPANVLYVPGSTSIPSLSMRLYMDGRYWDFYGCQGTVTFELTAAGACLANFTFSGLYYATGDASVPAVTYDGTRPGTFRSSRMLVDRAAVSLQTLRLDTGNKMAFPENPNTAEGFDPPLITARDMQGMIDPHMTLQATRDILTRMRAGNSPFIILATIEGGAASTGNRIALTIPSALATSYEPGDRNGLATEGMPFFPKGQDSGAMLCVF